MDAYTKLLEAQAVLLLLSCKGQLHFTMLGTYVTHLIEGSGKYQGNLLFCTCGLEQVSTGSTQEAVDVRLTWTDCGEAGDYVVPNVLSPRDLVSMDETVPHIRFGIWVLSLEIWYKPMRTCFCKSDQRLRCLLPR